VEVIMLPTVIDAEVAQNRRPVVLDQFEIDRRPWLPVAGLPGVSVKELWSSVDTVTALIALEPGAATPGSPHPKAQHDIWVLLGTARVAGREAPAGCYVHVPAGVRHPIVATGTVGCMVLQVQHLDRGALEARR
jgi:hypothetical protein